MIRTLIIFKTWLPIVILNLSQIASSRQLGKSEIYQTTEIHKNITIKKDYSLDIEEFTCLTLLDDSGKARQ